MERPRTMRADIHLGSARGAHALVRVAVPESEQDAALLVHALRDGVDVPADRVAPGSALAPGPGLLWASALRSRARPA